MVDNFLYILPLCKVGLYMRLSDVSVSLKASYRNLTDHTCAEYMQNNVIRVLQCVYIVTEYASESACLEFSLRLVYTRWAKKPHCFWPTLYIYYTYACISLACA